MSFVPNIKYKTEYCLYWKEGKYCEKGTHCFFAHGSQELRSIEEVTFCTILCTCIGFPSPLFVMQNHQQIVARSSQTGEGPAKPYNYKTIFCKFYAQGQCKLGDKCTYAHERREKRKKKMSQQYKLQANPQHQSWTQAKIQEYYNQFYYYQMYQSNPSGYTYPGQIYPQQLNQQSFRQQEDSNLQLQPEAHDTAISPEIKPDIREINQSQQFFINQKVQSPVSSHQKGSPRSGETQAPNTKPMAHFQLLEKSTEFRENE